MLLLALVLLLFLVRLIGGGSDGRSDDTEKASTVAAPQATEVTSSADPAATAAEPRPGKKTRTPVVLAEPDGPCDPSDVVVTPATRKAANDGKVELVLALTGAAEACTFRFSPETVALKISSGTDNIWFSQQCPDALPTQDVVVRSAVRAKVTVTWSGQRSDEDCSRNTDWALPGGYHAIAAALGGEPTDSYFELTRPGPVTVTVTPTPTQKAKQG